MPTFEVTRRFLRDYDALTPEQQAAFRAALGKFIHDLRAGGFRPGLRVNPIQGARGIFEMTWAADGRATFGYGAEVTPGMTHIIWRRCATHGIFTAP